MFKLIFWYFATMITNVKLGNCKINYLVWQFSIKVGRLYEKSIKSYFCNMTIRQAS